ncbi:MAG TPA: Nif3-like dinuclear metal center hexameric protein [Fibrobacteraceae bacterium]|nr:Nif3-like dinuclear metal center hexameric protein [Fibrobacteraceae bacterium]
MTTSNTDLKTFDHWLRSLLRPELYKDYCPNGLIVEAGHKVHRVVCGVSLSLDLIDEAVERKADALVVHHPHGFWNNQPRLPVGTLARKLKSLLVHGISLWGFHLPLDGHAEVGNNVGLARDFGVEPYGTFMREGQADIGLLCRFPQPVEPIVLRDKATAVFGAKGVAHALMHGPLQIETIAICSGGGASGIDEAVRLGCHAFLTGELKESSPIQAREEGIHLIACGHYATETYGPRLLAERITKDLSIPAEFVDIPNPV